MDLPEVFVFTEGDEDGAASDLLGRVEEGRSSSPFVLTSSHGQKLSSAFPDSSRRDSPPQGADQVWAAELGSKVKRSGSDLLVAIGGGRTLDLAKLAAARAGVAVFSVPTQLSHDGIASPIAVVPDETGRAQSLGAIAPHAIFLSIPTLQRASAPSAAAGLGDLLANPLALRDWALAAERGLDEIDQGAWDLSVESYKRIEPDLDTDLVEAVTDPGFTHRLADALILSGVAMLRSGNSRPASGAEHEVAHAIEALHGGRALHGAQVAFGSIISVALYEEDHRAFRERLRRLGLPQHPRELGLNEKDLVDVLLYAPSTRPGRFTILEETDLDEAGAGRLVREIWGNEAW